MKLIGIMSGFEEFRAEEQNGANVTAVKAALRMMGEDCGPTRPPSAWPLTDGQMARLRDLLHSWGLLPERSGPVGSAEEREGSRYGEAVSAV